MWTDTKKGHNCQLPQLSKHFEQRNLRLTFFCLNEKKNLYFFLIAVDLLTPIQNVVNTCDQWEFSVATTILKENICSYNFENEVDNRVGN